MTITVSRRDIRSQGGIKEKGKKQNFFCRISNLQPVTFTNSRMSKTTKVDHNVTMATQARRSSRQACCKFQGNHSDCTDDLMTLLCCCATR